MDDKKEKLQKKRAYWRNQRLLEKRKYRKNERIYLRCNENEKAYITLRAKESNSESLTDYIMECALFNYVNKIDFDFLHQHTVAINRLNNNINQIARRLNSISNDNITADDLNDLMNEILKLKKICNEITNGNEKIHRKLKNTLQQKEAETYDENVEYKNQ